MKKCLRVTSRLFVILFAVVLGLHDSVSASEPFKASINGGDAQSLAVKPDGTVWLWGDNFMGNHILTPEKMDSFSDVIAVSSGETASALALHADGTVSVWGYKSTPEKVSGLSGIIAIEAGFGHYLALGSDGTVFAWGINEFGQLGDGTTKNSETPVKVKGLSDVVAISAGGYGMMHNNGFSLALKKDGSVWAWGSNYSSIPARISAIVDAVAIAAGSSHSLALLRNGSVMAWGSNHQGQLGIGSMDNEKHDIPVFVSGISDVISISAGYHSLVLKKDGSVWGWGANDVGALGDGTTEYRSTPTRVMEISDVVAVEAGGVHSLALKADGSVWAWGWNGFGTVGDGATEDRKLPVQVSGLNLSDGNIPDTEEPDVSDSEPVKASINGGDSLSLAVKPDGSVWIWGDYYMGTNVLSPEKMEGLSNVVAVSSWVLPRALHADGTVSVWGDGKSPEKVSGLSDIIAIDAGCGHDLALRSDGTVLAWGSNESGQLGDGTTKNSETPVKVKGLSDVVAISAGGAMMTKWGFSLALKKDGSVWAWGTNYSSIPVKLSGIADAIAISAGASHSLALLKDGSVMAWGNNSGGQLGVGDTEKHTTPVLLDISEVVSVSAGYFSLALKKDGSVWAWGENFYGNLGDGTTEYRNTPTRVLDISGVISIAAGGFHSLALKSDGSVWAWGWNDFGTVGDGTTENRKLPVQVSGLNLSDGNSEDNIDNSKPPEHPVMEMSVDDLKVSVSWKSVKNANGYKLIYAPYPFAGVETIQSIDMGKTTGLSVELWDGAALYLAVQSYNDAGDSDYSNIRYFILKKDFALKTTGFSNGDRIPDQNSCTGQNISPAMSWSSPPDGIASFILIMDDPDAPDGTWTHWVVYDIPSNYSELSGNLPILAGLENSVKQAISDSGEYGYHGPCPPPGSTHHYSFRLWGLDVNTLGLSPGTKYDSVISTAKSHLVSETKLMGTFSQ